MSRYSVIDKYKSLQRRNTDYHIHVHVKETGSRPSLRLRLRLRSSLRPRLRPSSSLRLSSRLRQKYRHDPFVSRRK